MKKLILQSVVVLTCLGTASLAASEEIYTFDSDNQGWLNDTVSYAGSYYETLTPNAGIEWTDKYNAGNDGGGSVYQQAGTDWEGRAYWMGARSITPEDTLGDLTDKIMSTYVRSTANWQPRVESNTVYARWTIAALEEGTNPEKWNMWISKSVYSIDLNDSSFGTGSNNDWIYQSIKMVESNFVQWPNYSNGGTFADALKNYTAFGLSILPTASGNDDPNNFNANGFGSDFTLLHYGARSTSDIAEWGVDDFKAEAVPEPATLVLLGGGICCLAWYRRRKEN